MKDAEVLLLQRDKLFEDQTNVILERIGPTLDGIRDYLTYADPSYTPGVFNWEDISIFAELLMLVGIVRYDVGATFILDGDTIEITADNKEYFNRVLRIGIPFAIINQNDSTAVYDFLSQLHSAIEMSEEAARILNEDIEVIDPTVVSYPVNEFEFDLEELSDEQREALVRFEQSKKIN